MSVPGPLRVPKLGPLVGYGPNLLAGFRLAATYVDRTLKGANPSDLPVEQPKKLELAINLKTANALGITVPPALLDRADRGDRVSKTCARNFLRSLTAGFGTWRP
jgi:putative ABC transport system substrate-binding protein